MHSPNKTPRVVTTLSDKKLIELMDIVRSSDTIVDEECAIIVKKPKSRLSYNNKDYVQIKVKASNDNGKKISPNCKVQLHQLLAWNHPDKDMRGELRHAIENTKLEISHLCGNKGCTNPSHLCAEDSWTNKTRITCEVIINVDGVYYPMCRHKPPCIVTTFKRRNAFIIETNGGK